MWFDYVNSAGIVGALLASAYQAHRLSSDARDRAQDRRTERALDLYRDLVVEGDVAESFHHLSVLLRAEGSARHGANTWLLIDDTALQRGGLLDPTISGFETSFQNLYKVIWYFERVEKTMDFKLVDEDVVLSTIGYHCWWWGQLLWHVRGPKAVASLHALAPRAARWAHERGVYADWVARCQSDFGGAGPRSF